MANDRLTEAQHLQYQKEFAAVIKWASEGHGLRLMGTSFHLAIPGINSIEDGCRHVAQYCAVAHAEGFTPDVGVPTLQLITSAASRFYDQGAPVPSYEAQSALETGALGSSQNVFQNL
ncbi:UNVERIFIED_ORG: hypothetical protein EDC92_13213 [Dietzia maris]|jgi:hypothetical protein|uniref:hypothetical protein n=1 Tax=Dietzia TaxID=37914 RepID=UPI001048F28D|nr:MULTISPECIES: hypothetical protein [unclassified Dietzia]MDV3357299.1 hypothetical protein [Dietzia sp. IN118]